MRRAWLLPLLILVALFTWASLAPRPAARAQGTATVGRLAIQTESGGQLITLNPDGSDPVVVYQGGLDPAWSPDGTRIAFARLAQPPGIYVMDADGSNVTRVADIQAPRAPTWSPDGTKIVFYYETTGFTLRPRAVFPPGGGRPTIIQEPHEEPNWHLLGVELTTGRIFDVNGTPHSFDPSYSPDGLRIVFDCDPGLCLTDDRNGQAQLIPNTDTTMSAPAWSPDGAWIAFQFQKTDHTDIGLIRPDGSDLHLITQEPLFGTAPNNVAPAWSPDSQQLVFLTDRDGRWRHYLMNSDGSGQRPLTDIGANYQFSAERMASWGTAPPTRPVPAPPPRNPTPTPVALPTLAPPTAEGPVEIVEIFPEPVVNFQDTRIVARAPEGAVLKVSVVYCGMSPALNGSLLREIRVDASGLATWNWQPVTGQCHTTGRATVTADYNGQRYTATRDFRIQ